MVKLTMGIRSFTYDGRKLVRVIRQEADGDYLIEITELAPVSGAEYAAQIKKVSIDQLRNLFGCKRRERLIIAE